MNTKIQYFGNEHNLYSGLLRSFKQKAVFLIGLSLISTTTLFSQVGISLAPITPDPSSILELRSTSSGFLPPRMTTDQRDAISPCAQGLVIYNTTTNLLNFYDGSSWQISGPGGESAIIPVNTANKYLNGYKNFVTLHSDSLTEGLTNLFYTTARSILKVNISDTAAMLSNYRTAYQPIGNYATTAENNLKVNISDTVAMLANYQSAINTNASNITSNNNSIGLKVNIGDTAAMLNNYRTSYQPIGNYATTADNNLKVNISDTAAMLLPYAKTTDLSSEISGITNSTANTSFADNKYYWSRVLEADGFPITGFLTGYRKDIAHTQRIQSESGERTLSRYWIAASTAWSTWIEYVQKDDFTAKGVLLAGTGLNSFSPITVGANATVLTADNTTATGLKWASIPVTAVGVLTPGATIAVNFNTANVYTITASNTSTFNASGGIAGATYSLVITSTGAIRILTFGTNFKTTGTLMTTGISGKVHVISFVSDGTTFYETSRTTAM